MVTRERRAPVRQQAPQLPGRHVGGRSVAQVVLRWLTGRGIVAIPKSVRKKRMAENFAIFDFDLDGDVVVTISSLDRKASSFFDHRDPVMVKALSTRRSEDR